MHTAAGPFRALGRILLPFVGLNLAALLVYRLVFLGANVPPEARHDTLQVLLSGARLDMALLAGTVVLLAALSLLRLRYSLRAVLGVCIAITVLNLLLCAVNFVFYAERGEPLGRLLVANLTSPEILLSEVGTFASTHPVAAVLAAVLVVGLVVLGLRLFRRVPARTWSQLDPPKRILVTVAFGALAVLPLLEPVEVTGERLVEGWTVEVASARHYQRFDDYTIHQAIPNPLHELLFSRVPQALSAPPPPRLAPEEARTVLDGLLPGPVVDAEHPLVRPVRGEAGLGIENVLLLQIEGLSGSIVEREEDGRAVMPFLADLAKRSLYFPNTIQAFPTTYGALHCVTASLPRTASCATRGQFAYEELQGWFASLPRIVPGWRTRRSFYGSVHAADDVRAYMGNQGYVTTDHHQLADRLAGTRPREEIVSEVGVWDGPMLDEAVRVLVDGPHPALLHVMTGSTHSPWALPPSHAPAFEDKVLAGFHYLDACLRKTFETLEATPDLMARTLVVVTADHVSFGFGRNDLDWARIPLLFCHPRLAEAGLARRDERWATLTDVVPTVLAFLDGEHACAGLGRNLLADEVPFGVLFSNAESACYLRGDRLLRWRFADDSVRLLAADPTGWGHEDLGRRERERLAVLTREFFGLFEATRALVDDGRVWPRRP